MHAIYKHSLRPVIGFRSFVLCVDVDYHLTIRTGDIAGAGTDAPVFIQLIGDDGETERIELSPGGTGDKRFDRGRTDKFVIGTLDVGKVNHTG